MNARTSAVSCFFVAATSAASVRAAPFDGQKAETALSSVDTTGCGAPIPDWVDVTIDPSGKVTKVEAQPGAFSFETVKCVVARFETVTVAPFDGEPRVVQFRIGAPTAATAAGTSDEHASTPEPPSGHFEARRRPGLLVAGGIVLGVGVLTLLVSVIDAQRSSTDCGGFRQISCDDADSDRKSADTVRSIVGGGLIVLGGALLIAGTMTHTVYVADPPRPRAQILPWVAHGGGGVGMTLTF